LKRIIIATALASTFALSGLAHAANGIINFQGELINSTCTAVPGPGSGSGSGSNFLIDFGKVSIADLSDGTGTSHGGARFVNVQVDCTNATSLTTVKAGFDPAAGSGIDANDSRLLAVTGASRGAGIAMINEAGAVINLSGNETIDWPLTVDATTGDATALMQMRAAYVRNGVTPVPGANTAQLPFTLTFE
jgi:major type 1 subunit fimbrin (pilin)